MASNQKSSTFARDATGLVRGLSVIDVFLTTVLQIGFIFPFIYGYFASTIYQGVNLPITVWLGLPVVLIISYTYALMSGSFPRTGGDYVWASRVINPGVGFAFNFGLAIIFMSFVGINAELFLNYGVGPMLANLAVVTGNTSYLHYIPMLSQTSTVLVAALLFIGVLGGISLFRLKVSYRFMLVLFAIIVVAILTFIFAALYAGPSGFQANFDKLSGTSYAGILTAASNANFVTTFTVSGTLLGSVWTFFNYSGFNVSTYIAGEVRRNSRSQLYGMMLGVAIFALSMFAIFQVSYYAFGGQFVSAASLLSGSGNAAYTLPVAPVDEFLIVFSVPNPLVAFLVPLGVLAGTLAGSMVLYPVSSRMIFAWSFDRVIPERISRINGRGAPAYATGLVAIVAIIFVVLTLYTKLSTLILYESSLLWLMLIVGGISAMILPFRRKDLFDLASGAMKRKFGKIPLISVLGGFTAVASIVLTYATISPSVILTPLNAPVLFVTPIGIIVLGLVIYYVSAVYLNSRGMNLSLVFKEIPPE
jgi:basic amino acid/polyamine antiporter, APA family